MRIRTNFSKWKRNDFLSFEEKEFNERKISGNIQTSLSTLNRQENHIYQVVKKD
jgi:hypothetical protein